LYSAVHHGSMEAVEALLAAPMSADIATTTILGKAPLHAAAGQGRHAIATVLLENGADASQKDFKGMTPLHDAAYKMHEELYELIKAHETCDPDAKEELGYTAEDMFTGYTGVSREVRK
jgi:ankyrin repeat protein